MNDDAKRDDKRQQAIFEAARHVGIPGDKIAKFLGTLEMCGYDLYPIPGEPPHEFHGDANLDCVHCGEDIDHPAHTVTHSAEPSREESRQDWNAALSSEIPQREAVNAHGGTTDAGAHGVPTPGSFGGLENREEVIAKPAILSSVAPLTEWLRENAPDCGDNSCLFGGRGKGGMRTNGGCRCFKDLPTAKRIFVERLFAAQSAIAPRKPGDEYKCPNCGAFPIDRPGAIERDAQRYRWLRDEGAGVLQVYRGVEEHSLLPEELDEAIDAAMDSRNEK